MKKSRTTTIYDSRYRSIIAEVVEIRKEYGISQEELAKRIGLTQPDISKIERFERRLDVIEFFDFIATVVGKDKTKQLELLERIYGSFSRS